MFNRFADSNGARQGEEELTGFRLVVRTDRVVSLPPHSGEVVRVERVADFGSGEGATRQRKAWQAVTVDLAPFAGKAVTVELVNQPDGWSWEAAYWGGVEVK